MIKKSNMKYQVILVNTLFCTISALGFSAEKNDPNEILHERLAKITASCKSEVSALEKMEVDCLALVESYDMPSQKGKIYAKIAKIYSRKGFSSRSDIRAEKTINYCQKALEQPLDSLTSCEMYARLADTKIFGYGRLPQNQFVELRKEVIVDLLNGLKIALDNNAPVILPEPLKGRYKDQQARLAARKRWELEREYFFLRDGLTELCVSLYSHEPYDINEFRGFGQETLVDHPEAIDELVNKIQDRINSK